MTAPNTSISWLPRPTTTPLYPQNLLRPSGIKGCVDCTSQAYSLGIDSRRDLAGIASFAGLHGLGGRIPGFGNLGTLDTLSPAVRTGLFALSVASAGASAYHGYRRNNSVGWALWWGFCGGLFPIVTPAIALAQGFGKRARR